MLPRWAGYGNLTARMKVEGINQIGVVVRDVEAAARFLHEKLGMGPFGILELNEATARYRDQDIRYRLKVGLCGLGPITLELIQVVEGHPILKDYLPASGQGVHHLGIYVDDLDAAVAEWQAQGHRLLQRGSFMPGGGSAYLDTPDPAGILIELIQFPKGKS